MHRVSTNGPQQRSASVLVARLAAFIALAATIAVIVTMLLMAHATGDSTIHTIRPLPHNYFGH